MITFVGDVYMPVPIDGHGAALRRYVVNLESPITTAETPAPGKVNLKVSALHFEASLGTSPLAVCLANNHVMDFGAAGLRDTIETLRQHGIAYFGAGTQAEGHNNPAIAVVDGLKVALSGYVCPTTAPARVQDDGYGVAPADLGAIRCDIDRARNMGADRVVVCLHWGAEEVRLPKPSDVALARAIIDAGADAIVGHHPHVIQPWELRGEKPIFYSLGNFIMPDLDEPSYFTTQGASARRYVKRQAPWNRTSLAFMYEPRTRRVSTAVMSFDGKRVNRTLGTVRPTRWLGSTPLWPLRFRAAFVTGKVRQLTYEFLLAPRLPKPRHFLWFVRLLKSRDYR